MQKHLLDLAATVNAKFEENPQSYKLTHHRSDGFVLEVLVPRNVLEWFIDICLDGKAIWSDWLEYYPLDQETRDELLEAMKLDIEKFIRKIVSVPLRIETSSGVKSNLKKLEWYVDDHWEAISIICQKD